MNLIEKFKAWRSAEHPAPINLGNIWAVLQSFYRRNQSNVPVHLSEQVEYRRTVSNKECVTSNVCKCGCEWNDLIWSDKTCEGNCYPEMMDAKAWKTYKKTHKI